MSAKPRQMAPRHALETPPRRLLRQPKIVLARRLMELSRQLSKVASEVIPVTIEQDMRAGDTLQVRVPRLFIPW